MVLVGNGILLLLCFGVTVWLKKKGVFLWEIIPGEERPDANTPEE